MLLAHPMEWDCPSISCDLNGITPLLLRISYLGEHYYGSQIQTNVPTIQGDITQAFDTIQVKLKSYLASGRTDAKVDAYNQWICVHVANTTDLSNLSQLKNSLNSVIKGSIFVRDIYFAPRKFHPIKHAKIKKYTYQFNFEENKIDFSQKGVFLKNAQDYNVQKMIDGAKIFCGTFDFKYYYTLGTKVYSTTRTVIDSDLYYHPTRRMFCYSVLGKGFLKQMVRMMMGAIWQVGRESASLADLQESLTSGCAQRPPALKPFVAPGNGLILEDVQLDSCGLFGRKLRL